MVGFGLLVWAIGIPTLQTWAIVTGAVIVSGGVFGLLTSD